MKLTTHIYLDLLGVVELIENITTVVKDRLGLDKRRSHAELAGKTAIVTGGNAGVGYSTAEALVRHGANVVLACRSADRGRAAAEHLAAASGGAASSSTPSVDVELLDLASLASVREFVRRWAASGRPLDLLICNAGIMCPPERVETRDGFELQFQARRHWETTLLCSGAALPGAVSPRLPSWAAWMDLSRRCSRCLAPEQSNYLSHFLLANALVQHHQQQRRRRKGRGGGPLRVLFLTSMTHFGADLASDLADVPYCRNQKWHSFQAYANSKMCTLLAAKHMDSLFARDARQDAACGAASRRDAAVAVHPGLVDTFLARGYFKQTAPRLARPLTDPFFDHVFCPYLLRSPEAAAETVLYAAAAPAEEVGGRYCGTAPRVGDCSKAAEDPALAQWVWSLAAHLCQLGPDELVA